MKKGWTTIIENVSSITNLACSYTTYIFWRGKLIEENSWHEIDTHSGFHWVYAMAKSRCNAKVIIGSVMQVWRSKRTKYLCCFWCVSSGYSSWHKITCKLNVKHLWHVFRTNLISPPIPLFTIAALYMHPFHTSTEDRLFVLAFNWVLPNRIQNFNGDIILTSCILNMEMNNHTMSIWE